MDATFRDKTYIDVVIAAQPIRKLHICPPGEFIHKTTFDVSEEKFLYDYNYYKFRHQILWTRYRGYHRPSIIMQEFWCRGLFENSHSTRLEVLPYSNFRELEIWGFWTSSFKPYKSEKSIFGMSTLECVNGYAYKFEKIQTRSSRDTCPAVIFTPKYNKRACIERTKIQYLLYCSTTPNPLIATKVLTRIFNAEQPSPYHEYKEESVTREVSECPPKHGICGVEVVIYPPKLMAQPVTTEGFYFYYKCCPIPVRIMEKLCKDGVLYDVVVNKDASVLCVNEGTSAKSCKFETSTGQIISEQLTPLKPVYIKERYPDLEADITEAMGRYSKKRFGSGFWTLMSLNPNTMIAASGSTNRRSRKKRSVAFVAGFKSLIGIIDAVGKLSSNSSFSAAAGKLSNVIGIGAGLFDLVNNMFNPGPSQVDILNKQLEVLERIDKKLDIIKEVLEQIHNKLTDMQLGLQTKAANIKITTFGESFDVPPNAKPFMYNLEIKCGKHLIYRPGPRLRYFRPSMVCTSPKVEEKYDKIPVMLPLEVSTVNVSLSVKIDGYGVIMDDEGPDLASRYIPWELLTTESENPLKNLQSLGFGAPGSITSCPYSIAPRSLFQRANTNTGSFVNFTIPDGHLAALYRIKAKCGVWNLYTNMVFIRSGPPGQHGNIGFSPDVLNLERFAPKPLIVYPIKRKPYDRCFSS